MSSIRVDEGELGTRTCGGQYQRVDEGEVGTRTCGGQYQRVDEGELGTRTCGVQYQRVDEGEVGTRTCGVQYQRVDEGNKGELGLCPATVPLTSSLLTITGKNVQIKQVWLQIVERYQKIYLGQKPEHTDRRIQVYPVPLFHPHPPPTPPPRKKLRGIKKQNKKHLNL